MVKEQFKQGKDLWDALEGKKEVIKEELLINFAGVKGKITVVYRDLDENAEIYEEYDKKLPKKPTITINYKDKEKTLFVPVDDGKFKEFNNHPEAKEKISKWKKECKPVEKEKTYRIAYMYISDNEKPGKNPEEGTKILQKSLPYQNAIKIVNKGMEISNVGGLEVGKQEESS